MVPKGTDLSFLCVSFFVYITLLSGQSSLRWADFLSVYMTTFVIAQHCSNMLVDKDATILAIFSQSTFSQSGLLVFSLSDCSYLSMHSAPQNCLTSTEHKQAWHSTDPLLPVEPMQCNSISFCQHVSRESEHWLFQVNTCFCLFMFELSCLECCLLYVYVR